MLSSFRELDSCQWFDQSKPRPDQNVVAILRFTESLIAGVCKLLRQSFDPGEGIIFHSYLGRKTTIATVFHCSGNNGVTGVELINIILAFQTDSLFSSLTQIYISKKKNGQLKKEFKRYLPKYSTHGHLLAISTCYQTVSVFDQNKLFCRSCSSFYNHSTVVNLNAYK